MTAEQLLLEHWHSLPEEKQKAVLDFAQFLRHQAVSLPPSSRKVKRRFPIPELAGKVKIVGDIIGPIVDEEDWQCLR